MAPANKKIVYPNVRRDENIVDDYHGTKIADPYRYLEDPDAEEVKNFVELQNNLTVPFIEDCPVREDIRKRLTELWDYPKFSCPFKKGNKYFFFKNSGLQNQSVLYIQDTLDSEPRLFFDPNTLSTDGTVSINTYRMSKDGQIFAYGLSESGSDWVKIHFKKVEDGSNYPEVLERVKFSSISWTKDNKGIFYGRYPEQDGKNDGSETTSMEHQKLYYHKIGDSQDKDQLVVEFPDNPKYMMGGSVSDCGKYLVVTCSLECRDNLVFFTKMDEILENGIDHKFELTPVVTKFESDYDYITNNGSVFYFRTNKGAPNYRVIGIDFSKNPTDESQWTTLIEEHSKDVLDWAFCVNEDKLLVCYIQDVKNILELRSLNDGSLINKFPLEVGTIVGASGERNQSEFFFHFSSFLSPGKIYRCDLNKTPIEATLFKEVTLNNFDSSKFTTKQVFYASKDGTKIPMFIVHKNGIELNGKNPCLLYGYGGFNVSVQPSFSVSRLVYMNHFDGILAIPNIRGGGEYGENWHNNGRLLKKQNVFDDFIYAAEYLIDNKYTSSPKLTIQGASNGGLLVGACINQRPDLFGAAIAQVGVMDLLRFHKFTIGYAWCSDYGSSDEKEHFDNLIKLSPLHNVKMPSENGNQYPSVILFTADHDDRVVPLHSYKFIAELQHKLGSHSSQENPLLIRIDKKAGHGAGKPTAKVIEEYTDAFCFLVQSIGLKFNPVK